MDDDAAVDSPKPQLMKVPCVEHGAPQDVIVLAGWGTLSSWVVELFKTAAARAKSPITAEWVGHADDLSDLGNGSSKSRRFVMTQGPGASLHSALANRNLNIVAVLEEPGAATEYCRSTGVAPMAALRAVSHSMSAHLTIRNHPGVAYIFRSSSLKARDEAERILSHVGLRLDTSILKVLIDEFCGSELEALSLDQAQLRANFGPRPLSRSEWPAGVEVETGDVAKALHPVIRMAFGHPAETIVWDRSLFYRGTQLDEQAPRQFDLTGPPRQLFGGPLLHVPSGTYDVDICFKFTGVDPLPFRVEFCWLGAPDGPPPVQRWIEKAPAGHYRARMQLTLDRPQDVLDIRVTSLEAAIDGELEFEHIALTPLLG